MSAISDDSLIGIDSECGSFCFQSIQPVTDLLEIEGKPNSPKSPNMSASSSDVLTDLYEVDESLSGVDSEYDTEEFCLDFDFESTQMISDAESVILYEETSQHIGAINDPLEIKYADYNMHMC